MCQRDRRSGLFGEVSEPLGVEKGGGGTYRQPFSSLGESNSPILPGAALSLGCVIDISGLKRLQRVTGCILSNVNTPSMTPVIGQPQHETPQPIYQNNNNVPAKPTAAKILGKVGESLSRICCVRPPVERFTFVDENANLGTVMRYEEIGEWGVRKWGTGATCIHEWHRGEDRDLQGLQEDLFSKECSFAG
ncbi:hypothetical protein GHT09_019937 [Marmota monax]|uniref:Uncharacterized protein n=1 Tax=Marmota monax TaxID=9995 RepID=A0A834UIE4_MARMO|nr:hypothetical protein GHT09_019937 [Marmota monax]